MLLIPLDLEDDRPFFIEDPAFNVIPDIEDLLDAVSDFLEEDEEGEDEGNLTQNGHVSDLGQSLDCDERRFHL